MDIKVVGENIIEKPTHFLRTWNIGMCRGSLDEKENEENIAIGNYGGRCCLNPGKHTLICRNLKKPYGWGKAAIRIQGQEYCNDFVGFKAFRHVLISGKLI